MPQVFCNLLSPVYMQEKNVFIIPPIIYSRKVFLIHEKRLYQILDKVGLYKDYIQVVRENGYSYTAKWLKSKGLLNIGFLENASRYWLDSYDIQKIHNYKVFQRDLNNNPVITGDNIKNMFKKAFLFNYIQKKQTEFNNLVEKELNFIESELGSIKDIKIYEKRKNTYKRNFCRYLLESFFVNIDDKLSENLQKLETLNIEVESSFKTDNLALYKAGNLTGYKKLKFEVSETAYQEFLKENTFIRLHLFFNRFLSGRYSDINFLNFLIDNSAALTESKILFDKEYFANVFNQGSDTGYLKVINSLNNCICSVKNDGLLALKNNITVLENSRELFFRAESFITGNLLNSYEFTNNANFLFCSNSDINKIVCLLNMERGNINRLNELLFSKNNKIESQLAKLTFKSGNTPFLPCGFANINYS